MNQYLVTYGGNSSKFDGFTETVLANSEREGERSPRFFTSKSNTMDAIKEKVNRYKDGLNDGYDIAINQLKEIVPLHVAMLLTKYGIVLPPDEYAAFLDELKDKIKNIR